MYIYIYVYIHMYMYLHTGFSPHMSVHGIQHAHVWAGTQVCCSSAYRDTSIMKTKKM